MNQQSLAEELGQSSPGIHQVAGDEDVMLNGYQVLNNEGKWGVQGAKVKEDNIEVDDMEINLNYAVPYSDSKETSQEASAMSSDLKETPTNARDVSLNLSELSPDFSEAFLDNKETLLDPKKTSANLSTGGNISEISPNLSEAFHTQAKYVKDEKDMLDSKQDTVAQGASQNFAPVPHPPSVPKIITPAQPVSSDSDSDSDLNVDEELKLADLMMNPIGGEKKSDLELTDSDSENIQKQYKTLAASNEFVAPLPSDHVSYRNLFSILCSSVQCLVFSFLFE